MMKRLITISLAILLLFFIQGCLERNIAETQAKLTSSLDSISAEAEFLPGTSDSLRTVRIISNRSWYAHLNEQGDVLDPSKGEFVSWGKLDITDHANLTNVTDTVDLNIIFTRNLSESPVNGVLNLYAEGEKMLSVPVVQSGAVYRLSADADKLSVSCLKDTVKVYVDCNTSWSASLSEATTADVILDNETGFDPDTLLVIFNQNLDAVNTKLASVILKAQSCEDCAINITQEKAVPYLRLADNIQTAISPIASDAEFSFQTNRNWSVRADESSSLIDIAFDKSAGEPSSDEIKVRFTFRNPGDDPCIVNSAKIIISAEGNEDLVLDYTQRAPLKLDFYSQKEAPYGLKTDYSSEVYELLLTTSISEYKLPLYNCKFRSKTDGSHGLQIPQDGYIGLPGIDGFKITAVGVSLRYHSSFRKIRLSLRSPGDFSEWYSGVLASYVISEDWSHTFVSGNVTLPESQGSSAPVLLPEGNSCVLLNDKKDMNNLIKTITIVYEPAE